MKLTIYRSILCMSASLALSCADDASSPNPIYTNTAQAPLKHFCKALTDTDDDGVIDIIEENQFGPNGSFIYTVKVPLNGEEPQMTYEVKTDSSGKVIQVNWNRPHLINETKYTYNTANQLISSSNIYTETEDQLSTTIKTEKQFTYNKYGSLKTLFKTREQGLTKIEQTVEYTYTDNKIVATSTHLISETPSQIISTTELSFNKAGKIKIIKQYDSRNNNLNIDQDFSYDQSNKPIESRSRNSKNTYIYKNDRIIKKVSSNTKLEIYPTETTITYDSKNRILKQEKTTNNHSDSEVSFNYEDNTIYTYLHNSTAPHETIITDENRNIIKYTRELLNANDTIYSRRTTTYDYSCLGGSPPIEPIAPASCNIQDHTFNTYKKQPCDIFAQNLGQYFEPVIPNVPDPYRYVSLINEVVPYKHLNHLHLY